MPTPSRQHTRKRTSKPEQRRALELLSAYRDGCPEALMIAHGFMARLLAALVRNGLATASSERMLAGKKPNVPYVEWLATQARSRSPLRKDGKVE